MKRILVASLLAACAGDPNGSPDAGPADDPRRWSLASVIDLGPACTNPGSVAVAGELAVVSCGGSFRGADGAVAFVDLESGGVDVVPLSASPGAVHLDGETVFVADVADGQVFVLHRDGRVIHGPGDAVVLCPSDPAAGRYEFVGDLVGSGPLLHASCFASDTVVAFSVDASQPSNARAHGRVLAGDGVGALAPWDPGRLVTADSLAGTLSLVRTDPLAAEPSRWQAGEVPNDVVVAGDHAVVANSLSHTVQRLDLVAGVTVSETFTGDATNPWSLALVDASTALVSLQLSGEVAAVDLGGARVLARVAMPTGEALLPFPGRTPLSRPQGLALAGPGRAVVTLTNLDAGYEPAGPGLLALVEWSAD